MDINHVLRQQSNYPQRKAQNRQAANFNRSKRGSFNLANNQLKSKNTNAIDVKTETVVNSLKSEHAKSSDDATEKTFYRYTISQFNEIKQCFPSVAKTPSELQHPLLNDKLNHHVHKILFSGVIDVNNKNELLGRKHITLFGPSSAPNSGKMRRNENFNDENVSSRKVEDSGIIRIFLNKTVNLKESEHAWKPTLFKAKEDSADQKREVIMLSKFFRSLLNKMTEDNFETLLPQIKKQQINTSEKLDTVVNMLFEKTISDPGYTATYAKLCKILVDENPNLLRKSLVMQCKSEFEKSPEYNLLVESIIVKIGELKAYLKTAHDIAERLNDLNNKDLKITDDVKSIDEQIVKCNQFLEIIANKVGKTRSPLIINNEHKSNVIIWVKRLISTIDQQIEELDNFRGYLRRRATGTVKFIGNLYKVDLLSSKIMFTCIRSLLNCDAKTKTCDDNLERLSSLLTTIGSKLDLSESKALDDIFNKLQQIRTNNQFDESRTGFAIENVIELRSRSWVPRKNQRSSEINPMKLEDFAEQMRKQEEKKQFQNGNYHHQNNWRGNQSQRQASSQESIQKFHRQNNGQISNQRIKMTQVQKQQNNVPQYIILKRHQPLPELQQRVPVIETEEKVSKLTAMPKEDFENLMKALLDGKILMEEFLAKMKSFCVDSESLMLVMCFYHDRSSSERLFIAKACLALMEQDKNSISKEVVSAALDECFEFAEDFICDVPKIYEILAEYYCDFRELGLFDEEFIEAACNAEKKSKFTKLFNSDGSYKKSKVEEKMAVNEKIVVTESNPQTPSMVIKPQDESLSTIQVDSTVKITSSLSDDEISQQATDKLPGKFNKIRKKFEFTLKKNIKKQNLEPLIKIIETENCKHEETFVAELTEEILKTCCQKVKNADKKQIKSLMGNTLDLIKLYFNKSLTMELQIIAAIQAYICDFKKQLTGKLF